MSGENTTDVEADTGAAEPSTPTTVLAGDAGDAGDAGAAESTKQNSNAANTADDTADADGSDSGDAGGEGSQTPNDTYADFTLPDGMEVDAIALEEVTPIFKELGLTQEQSQKLVDHYAKQVQAGSQKQVDTFNQLTNDWREQSQNDKEFGGDKFEENVKVAQNAIGKYGTPELKQLLNDHGVGNHPEVIRFMVRVGQTLKEDVPGSAGSTVSASEDHATQLYGKTT